MTTIEELKKYVDQGWYIFPLVPNKKNPITEHGVNDSTNDLNQIKKWLEQYKNCNWGLDCGKSGKVVVDIDPKNGGNVNSLPLPRETLIVNTPSGGYHFYFNSDKEYKNSVSKISQGLDVRATGGYVVIPPSTVDGNDYRFVSKHPILELPEWLGEKISEVSKPTNVNPNAIYPEGERNSSLASFAGLMRKVGMSHDEIIDALSSANKYRCDIPVDEEEVLRIAKSISRYERGNADKNIIVKSAKLAFQPREPKKYVIEGVIPEKSISIWVGRYGSKKTFSCFSAAICVALGNDWIGHKTNQTPVLFVDEENGETEVLDRIQRAIIGEGGDQNTPVHFTSLFGFNLFKNPEDAIKLKEIALSVDAKLVFIDSLRDVMVGGKENTAEDTQIVFMNLRKIAEETGIAFVVLHHENKGGGISGSTAIPGAVDIALQIKSDVGSEIVRFETDKVRSSSPFKFDAEIHFEQDCFYMSATSNNPFEELNQKQVNGKKQTIIDYFIAHDGEVFVNDFLKTIPKEARNSYRSVFYKMARGSDKKIERIGEAQWGGTRYKLLS